MALESDFTSELTPVHDAHTLGPQPFEADVLVETDGVLVIGSDTAMNAV